MLYNLVPRNGENVVLHGARMLPLGEVSSHKIAVILLVNSSQPRENFIPDIEARSGNLDNSNWTVRAVGGESTLMGRMKNYGSRRKLLTPAERHKKQKMHQSFPEVPIPTTARVVQLLEFLPYRGIQPWA